MAKRATVGMNHIIPLNLSMLIYIYYLRQVNEVNGGDNAFVRCVSVCLSVCVCAAAGQWELNANSSKTVKATDLKFDILVPGTVRT